jgi:protein-tyrosine phosphatase
MFFKNLYSIIKMRFIKWKGENMVKVLFVCLGNICRSPMAEFVMKDCVKKRGLESNFLIDSAATSDYNEKYQNRIYPEVKEILKENHIPFTDRVSKQMRKEDYHQFDYILGMDEQNIRDILHIIGSDLEHKVYRLLDFTEKPRDIIDPWYYGNFDATYEDIKYGCEKLLDFVLNSRQ